MMNAIYERFIPNEIRANVMQFAKAKNIVVMGIALSLLTGFFAVVSSALSIPPALTIICALASIGYTLPLVALRLTCNVKTAGAIITTKAFLVVLALTFVSEQTGIETGAWFALIPLVGAMTSGRKMSAMIGGVSVAALALWFAMNGAFANPSALLSALSTISLVGMATMSVGVLENSKGLILSNLNAERERATEETAKAEALAVSLAEEKRCVEQKIAEGVAEAKRREKRLAEGVHIMLKAMNDLAAGNLTARVAETGDDELAQLFKGFNHVAAQFQTTMSDVQEAIHLAANTGAEVNHAATQIAAAVAEQSSQMTQIAAAMEQMFQTVRSNAASAGETAEAATENVQNAHGGNNLMRQMLEKMDDIQRIAQNSERLVAQLHSNSEEIGEVVSVIHEIADQTNLLALNAAIEAARAGEHGRGFSVVADEVRKLAERTVSATKQISQTVKDIQNRTGAVLGGITTSALNIREGITLAGEVRSSFEMIVAGDEVIRMKVEEIAAATAQQSSSSQQINSGIQQISSATEETSVIVQEVSASTENLSKRMHELLRVASTFKTQISTSLPTAQSRTIEVGEPERPLTLQEGLHGRMLEGMHEGMHKRLLDHVQRAKPALRRADRRQAEITAEKLQRLESAS
jgi:methyl-accepting chemotaxis protein